MENIENSSYRKHNNLVCSITNNIEAVIDKRMVKFIYNSINYSNKTSSNILRVKLQCVNSIFSANYQYLTFMYGLTEANWYINIDHLMRKVRKQMFILYSRSILCNIYVLINRAMCHT